MALDPRTPVLVGAGQAVQRAEGVDDARSPAALMADAARQAAADAGLSAVPDPDSIRIVELYSWRYRDPARAVADELGVTTAETALTTAGGNSPQMLVNATAAEIQAGRLDLALLAGGETWRSRGRARRAGVKPDWPRYPDDPTRRIGSELDMSHPAEVALEITMPVQVYPMFETALRAEAGEDLDTHQVRISELWARFSEVASTNPYAWVRERLSAEEIRAVGPDNRMIGLPYPKYMNSNNDVDLAAAVLLCSVERARALGVAEDRWVFPRAGADCHDHLFVSHREDLRSSPAVRVGGRAALALAGLGIDDVDLVDLYSCFPSAVQIGAAALGLPTDGSRSLTRTGGLTFAGGPWNNYSMHGIATVARELREGAGQTALVWANGGYCTKHGFGVYATSPPADGFRTVEPQDEIDALPRRGVAEGDAAAGTVTVEAYSVMHDRDGAPEIAYAACLLPDGRRAWGRSPDPDVAKAMCAGEWVGRSVRLDPVGDLHP